MTSEQVFYWGMALGCIITIPLALLFGVWALARLDVFFTFLAEGTGMAIMAGGQLVEKGDGQIALEGGKLHRLVIAFDDHRLQYEKTLAADEVVKGKEDLSFSLLDLLQRLGIYWIGVYPFFNRLRYMFWWTEEVRKHQDVGGSEIRERYEATNFFFVSVVAYKVRLIGVEIAGNLAVDYEFTVFVQIILPEIAIFRVKDWFKQLVAFAKGNTVGYARDKEFDTLNTQAEKLAFAQHLLALNPILREQVGIRLVGIEEVEVALTGGASVAIQEAVSAKRVAQFKGDAAIMAAEKQAKVVRINAAAEVRRVRSVYRAVTQHKGGLFIRRQEALERAGDKGNTIVFTGEKEPDAGDKTLVAIDRNNKKEGDT